MWAVMAYMMHNFVSCYKMWIIYILLKNWFLGVPGIQNLKQLSFSFLVTKSSRCMHCAVVRKIFGREKNELDSLGYYVPKNFVGNTGYLTFLWKHNLGSYNKLGI